MSIVYNVKAGIVNESATQIARFAAKIIQVANTEQGFIKTFPYPDFRNRAVLHLIKNELPPNRRKSYIGIGFTSYNCINYLELYSAFSAFSLEKGDIIELYFENEEIVRFSFMTNGSQAGTLRKNVHPLSEPPQFSE